LAQATLLVRHSPIRSWAYGVLPDQERCRDESCSPDIFLICGVAAPRVSPALQRIDETDALPFLHGSSPIRIGSLFEVLHRP